MIEAHYTPETITSWLRGWVDRDGSRELEEHLPVCDVCATLMERCASCLMDEDWSAGAHGRAVLRAHLLKAGDAMSADAPSWWRETLRSFALDVSTTTMAVVRGIRDAATMRMGLVASVIGEPADASAGSWGTVETAPVLSAGRSTPRIASLGRADSGRVLCEIGMSGELRITISGLTDGEPAPVCALLGNSPGQSARLATPVWTPEREAWVASFEEPGDDFQLLLIPHINEKRNDHRKPYKDEEEY